MKKQVRQIEVPCELDAMPSGFADGPKKSEIRRITPNSFKAPVAFAELRSINSNCDDGASKAPTPSSGHRPVVVISLGDVISAHGLGVLLSPGLWV